VGYRQIVTLATVASSLLFRGFDPEKAIFE